MSDKKQPEPLSGQFSKTVLILIGLGLILGGLLGGLFAGVNIVLADFGKRERTTGDIILGILIGVAILAACVSGAIISFFKATKR